MSAKARFTQLQYALASGQPYLARKLLLEWMRSWIEALPERPGRQELRQPELWDALASFVERTGEQDLLERFWQVLDRLPAPAGRPTDTALPLLGVPILNRIDLLERLLMSIDHPVHTLAIVDNSAGGKTSTDNRLALESLRERGHPLINSIQIARPFTNLGVAASWNLILTSFPQAPLALLANNDIQFAPGVLKTALGCIDASRAQFLSLLSTPHAFSAFLLTCRCWDRLGLFDPNFHPAYCEDLDYRDRLLCQLEVQQLDGGFAHTAMASCNPNHSATINSDPTLERHNRHSYALNRLWYLSERRRQGDKRGTWRRLWLNQWSDEP